MDLYALSDAEVLAQQSDAEREAFYASLTEEQAQALVFDWKFWSRPKQRPPAGAWTTWLILGGRGAGKTRPAAEWVREKALSHPGCRIHLVAQTAADYRDTMVEGETGLLACSPDDFRPEWTPSRRRLRWPNGSMALCFSDEKPRQLRGPQAHYFWVDEFASFRHPRETWANLMMGTRLPVPGGQPQGVVSTTPAPIEMLTGDGEFGRPLGLIKNPTTRAVTITTYENLANLDPAWRAQILAQYEGTRLGDQELLAKIPEDTPGALWQRELLEGQRVKRHPPMLRTVVALDPSVAADGEGDECGIVVAGVAMCECKVATGGRIEPHLFVLDDLTDHLSPDAWGRRALEAYRTHSADRIIAEANNGGGLVEVNLRTIVLDDDEDQSKWLSGSRVPYRAVSAAVGKRARAEPVAALYEQDRAHHVGTFGRLESELLTWVPLSGQKSPNRLDALVWAATDLMLEPSSDSVAANWATFGRRLRGGRAAPPPAQPAPPLAPVIARPGFPPGRSTPPRGKKRGIGW